MAAVFTPQSSIFILKFPNIRVDLIHDYYDLNPLSFIQKYFCSFTIRYLDAWNRLSIFQYTVPYHQV